MDNDMDSTNGTSAVDTAGKGENKFAQQKEEKITAAEVMAIDRHSFELSAIHQSELEFTTGSVLAIVRFPQDCGVDCNGYAFKDVYKIRVDYDRLLATGSAKIQAMLAPRYQERVRRRLNLQQLPEGIDFVIDLTPPSEGPERADLVASLWLPKATKLWFLSGRYSPSAIVAFGQNNIGYVARPHADKPVGAVLVLGHDDKCSCVKYRHDSYDKSGDTNDTPGIFAGPHVPEFRQIEDYCEVRHRVNIIRLIRAINGAELLINSAPRMWTLAQIAIDLEITSVVRDSIAQWFLAPPNTKFIEIFPEESFKVALALQIPDVLVTSFKILVNEFAVDLAATGRTPQLPPTTWAQRRRGDYGDMPNDPVEHAATALYERTKKKLDLLCGDTALDQLGIPEWDKLIYLGPFIAAAEAAGRLKVFHHHRADLTYRRLVDRLKDYFRDYMDLALSPLTMMSTDFSALMEAQRLHYIPKAELMDMSHLQERLNNYQRALCPFFWEQLRSPLHPSRGETRHRPDLERLIREFNMVMGKLTPADLDVDGTLFEGHDDPRPQLQFDVDAFIFQVTQKLKVLSQEVLGSDWEIENQGPTMLISDHIIRKLDDAELKFLPIWAGGCDDGSGGVFQDTVPPTDMGPSEPGPAYHTGHTVVPTDAATTTGAAADDDAATETHPRGPSSVSELRAGMSLLQAASTIDFPLRSVDAQGSTTTMTVTADRDFAEAMRHEPADHQAFGQALMAYVDGHGDGDGDAESMAASTGGGSGVVVGEMDENDFMLSDDTLSVGTADGHMSDFEML